VTNDPTAASATVKPAADRPGAPPPSSDGGKKEEAVAEQITALKAQLADQQRQIDELRRLLAEQQKLIAPANPAGTAPSGVVLTKTAGSESAGSAAAARPGAVPQKSETAPEEGPLNFKIGAATITPVGFMDFTSVFRSTEVGSSIGTNFGGIPYNNVVAGKLTELRFSAQNSRIGFRVDTVVKGARVLGYFESDFLGSAPGNVAVSSNSDPNRLRLFWVDVRKDRWEILGGQDWSMATPNRKGLSPLPSDIFYSQDIDTNYQAGLVWARQPQFRLIYHPNDSVALGVSFENPEQYIGGSAGAGTVTLPSALATTYGGELSNGNSTLATPNVHPDIIPKVAWDTKLGRRDFHLEAMGLLRTFRVYNPVAARHFSATGGGFAVNLNAEIAKNVRFITNNYYSDGGGRYVFGIAPDLAVRGDGGISLIHSGAIVTGFEAQATRSLLLYGYYGGVFIGRNVQIDPANSKLVGYGYAGSPNGQNKSIQEGTFGFTDTFWRNPKYGALQFMGQFSYLLRHPWSIAPGAPRDAHAAMVFFNLRYVLPGSAPKVK
jgi:hypothetical protein